MNLVIEKAYTLATLRYGLSVDNLRVMVDSSLQIAEAVYVLRAGCLRLASLHKQWGMDNQLS